MKYRCLVFDHDDTVVNITATIHHPCFQLFLDKYFPGRVCSLEQYFLKNFSPGFLEMCRQDYGMDEAMIAEEGRFWMDYVQSHVPAAYYGWEKPESERKPSPFPLEDIMRRFSLAPKDLLVIDDLKPGCDMALAAGTDFAAVGWANDIPQIETFMRENCTRYFKTVEAEDYFTQVELWI